MYPHIDKISASRLKMFERCPAKWHLKYIEGIRHPPTDAMLYGSKCHTDIELYLQGERLEPHTPEVWEIIERGLIPEGERQEIELVLDGMGICYLDDIQIIGRIDLLTLKPRQKTVQITDWKFRSNLSATEQKIDESPQLNLYGWALSEMDFGIELETYELEVVECKTEEKGGPHARSVSIEKSKADLDRYMTRHVKPKLRQMNRYVDRDFRHVPKNMDACYDYGPCRHMTPCHEIDYIPPTMSED